MTADTRTRTLGERAAQAWADAQQRHADRQAADAARLARLIDDAKLRADAFLREYFHTAPDTWTHETVGTDNRSRYRLVGAVDDIWFAVYLTAGWEVDAPLEPSGTPVLLLGCDHGHKITRGVTDLETLGHYLAWRDSPEFACPDCERADRAVAKAEREREEAEVYVSPEERVGKALVALITTVLRNREVPF